jgi:hypothetical protein
MATTPFAFSPDFSRATDDSSWKRNVDRHPEQRVVCAQKDLSGQTLQELCDEILRCGNTTAPQDDIFHRFFQDTGCSRRAVSSKA